MPWGSEPGLRGAAEPRLVGWAVHQVGFQCVCDNKGVEPILQA